MELKIQRIHEDAKLPLYQHKGDAGLDIFSSIDCVLEAGEVKPVPTGIRVAVPDGYVGLVWDKSGISLKGYRGEVRVVMVNLGNEAFVIEKGMKIAQLLVQPVTEVKVVEAEELETTSRGEEGFGSTGKY